MNETISKKQILTIREFADAIGVHEQTVRRWDRDNKLKPAHKTPSGHRRYTYQQVQEYLHV